MDYAFIISIVFITLSLALPTLAQSEEKPYENVQNICKTCECKTAQDIEKNYHHLLDCRNKNFTHILPRWPPEFGIDQNGVGLVATFSYNNIPLLQQLPATNGNVRFSCSHCNMKDIQTPTFMDVPHIIRLDLSWNLLTVDSLTPDVFRGPYKNNGYEPIGLRELDLSHNKLNSLEKLLFIHTPNLTELNLSGNLFKSLDTTTTLAISSATTLELLDLSENGLEAIPTIIFKKLVNLKTLMLNGNRLKTVPASLNSVGKTLEHLNIAGNLLTTLDADSFNGLRKLKKLNISSLSQLTAIKNGTFSPLVSLEFLWCNFNFRMSTFDVDGLLFCRNLTYLDVSYGNLETVNVNVDLSKTLITNFTAHWPKLRSLKVTDNPWACDCKLMRIFEYCGADIFKNDKFARCQTPFGLAGIPISNLTSQYVCDLPVEIIVPDNEDPPRFLRRRYIVLTIVTVVFVIIIGLFIGFLTACIRRRLKRDDYGIAPVRYTSVRCSNQSAMSITK